MASIADLSKLAEKLTGGDNGTPENPWFQKVARAQGAAATAPIIGRAASLWTYEGNPSAGAVPTTVAAPDNTTAGGLKQADPGGGREKWLHSVWGSSLVPGTLILYDRLLHIGGLNGTTTTAQTVGGSLTRYTNGAGNFAFLEIYTIIGTTGTTFTMEYTDQDGNAAQVSPAMTIGGTGFREVTRAIDIPLASGDTGIRAVANVDLLATTGTAGNFGLTVGHKLATIDIPAAGALGGRTFAQGLPGFVEIETDACLAWLFIPAAATAPEMWGGLSMLEA